MNLISFIEYQNKITNYKFPRAFAELSIPKNLVIQLTLKMAKSVQDRVSEPLKYYSDLCIETVEDYLLGKASQKDCSYAYYAASDAEVNEDYDQAYSVARYAAIMVSYTDSHILLGYLFRAASAAGAVDSIYSYPTSHIKIIREYFSWELVCGYQIAKVMNQQEDINFILENSRNKKLISYATMILSEESMHQNFEFFMRDFFGKRL